MKKIITLRLDAELIKRAQTYAEKNGKSITQVVADYFSLLDAKPEIETSEFTPLVRSLKGSLTGAKVDEKDYHKYLDEKYL
jgi:hypothetical protein